MKVSVQPHTSHALPTSEESLVPIELEAVWIPGQVLTLCRRETFPATAENRTQECPDPTSVATLSAQYQLDEEHRTLVSCPHFSPFPLQLLLGAQNVFFIFRALKGTSVF
jgi:hypothetical protein